MATRSILACRRPFPARDLTEIRRSNSKAYGQDFTLQRSNVFAERVGPQVKIRDQKGVWRQAIDDLQTYDSMLTHCGDPRAAPELLDLRESMRSWRFYDHFRTDSDAPARRRQVGARTPVLASDGSDLAAAIGTIQEIGAHEQLDARVADAFPGGAIDVRGADGYFEVEMRQHGLLRPLKASEFSDGTLRYLLLIAALMTPRPPPLMILNEPETSSHPDLLPPLARLIASASSRSQIVVVTHAANLATPLRDAGARHVVLTKELGETVAAEDERPGWNWPSRWRIRTRDQHIGVPQFDHVDLILLLHFRSGLRRALSGAQGAGVRPAALILVLPNRTKIDTTRG